MQVAALPHQVGEVVLIGSSDAPSHAPLVGAIVVSRVQGKAALQAVRIIDDAWLVWAAAMVVAFSCTVSGIVVVL